LANNVLKSVPVNYHLQSLQTHITYIKQSHIRTLNQQLLWIHTNTAGMHMLSVWTAGHKTCATSMFMISLVNVDQFPQLFHCVIQH